MDLIVYMQKDNQGIFYGDLQTNQITGIQAGIW